MEILSSTTTFSLLVITFITIIVFKFLASLHRQQNYWKNHNVPYIKPVPVLGPALKFLLRQITFIEYSELVYNSYSNARYIGTMNSSLPNLVIRDPELIREITVKYFDHFTDHKAFVDEDIEPLFSKNVFMLRGERWREMRNILTPTFTANKMKFMFELVSKCSQQFVDYLYDHPEEFSSLDAKDAFGRYTNDVIATVAFGVSVNSLKDRDNEFYRKGKSAFSGLFGNVGKLTLMGICPALFKITGITLIPRDTTDFFRAVILEALKAREKDGIVRQDMLNLLIQAKDKDKPTVHQMTVDDIVSQALIFFLAGLDSTSNLMSYMAYELALCPDAQERLRKEIDGCLQEGNGEISYETLTKMEYMDMVVSETLRKNPGVVFMDRVCTRKFEFPPAEPGYGSPTMYPGETIWLPVYALHHDPKYFPDPEKFDPERFSEENKSNVVPYTYLPFGAGPRKCIGDRFAMMETKILMVQLLHKFILKPIEKTQIPMVFQKNTFIPTPEKGFWIGLEKRVS
ncbi:Cytochrome P450 9e2 [Habropoda laboriosa]|uniref:Cytochrome P450 9e2 n=1 Tax=Habropoda laboriosa TaxID=597456 RepID=A0A0L7QRI0_9HYME|nr:Cytochrome P450 9e2 [Habropoda laboriosa]